MKGSLPKQIGNLRMQGSIGDGAFSVVKLAKDLNTGKFYVVKIVPKSRLNNSNLEERFETEIRVNQQLHHPGIVQMHQFMSDADNYYIVMEFCPNGELFQHIIDQGHLREHEAKILFWQLINTIAYIHRMGVSHRDLKPENLLLDEVGGIKISDFGLSRFVGRNNLVKTPCGSPCYASPECLSGHPYNGLTTDMWSCGVILYAMLTGQLPWTKRNQTELFRQIRSGDFTIPSNVCETGRSMIEGLMTVDPLQRLTAEKALKHPFLKDVEPQFHPEKFFPQIISLKAVDAAFAKDVSMSSLCGLPKKLTNSANSLRLKKVLRIIKPRKTHRKDRNQDDGRKHHHHHHHHD